MAKAVKKTIQRIETAKISELYKTEKSTSIDDLKLKLANIETTDSLLDMKNKLLQDNENDSLLAMKKALEISYEEEKEEVIEEIFNESEKEEEVIEKIIELEKQEEVIEEKENIEISEIIEEIIEDDKYYYHFSDSIHNNILIREVIKKKDEKIIVHIVTNNLNFDDYKLRTSSPFEIYHKGVKVIDFYQFKNDKSIGFNFKKDIYILKNNLIIDSKTYLLEEIEIVNINL